MTKEREPPDKDAEERGGATEGGFAKAARAVGRAFGFIRRLGPDSQSQEGAPGKRRQPAPRKVRQKERAPARVARITPSGNGGSPDRLRASIERIEAELDQVHAMVVQGAGAGGSGSRPAGAQELNKLILHARELKEKLREKQAELSKLERDTARERLLRQQDPTAPPPQAQAPQPSPPREPDRTAGGRPAREGRPGAGRRALRAVHPGRREPREAPSGLHDAMRRALTERANDDPAQRLVFERLTQDLQSENPRGRRAAVTQLAELSSPGVLQILRIVAEDPSEKVRAAALNGLARQGDKAALGLFSRNAASTNPHLRLAALRGLAKVGGTEANDRLLQALEDDNQHVRRTAVTLLGWREAKEAAMPLILTLRDHDETVRAAAATALGEIREERAVLGLLRALLDEILPVRDAAHKALALLLGEELDIDPGADAEVRRSQVDNIKTWWSTARAEEYFDRRGIAPMTLETATAKGARAGIEDNGARQVTAPAIGGEAARKPAARALPSPPDSPAEPAGRAGRRPSAGLAVPGAKADASRTMGQPDAPAAAGTAQGVLRGNAHVLPLRSGRAASPGPAEDRARETARQKEPAAAPPPARQAGAAGQPALQQEARPAPRPTVPAGSTAANKEQKEEAGGAGAELLAGLMQNENLKEKPAVADSRAAEPGDEEAEEGTADMDGLLDMDLGAVGRVTESEEAPAEGEVQDLDGLLDTALLKGDIATGEPK